MRTIRMMVKPNGMTEYAASCPAQDNESDAAVLKKVQRAAVRRGVNAEYRLITEAEYQACRKTISVPDHPAGCPGH